MITEGEKAICDTVLRQENYEADNEIQPVSHGAKVNFEQNS
jgi:hypothetical protein